MHRWYISNNWMYTLTMTFVLTNIMYFTRLMQYSDEAVITAMIEIDQSLTKLSQGRNQWEVERQLSDRFQYDRDVMDDISKWSLFDGFNIMFFIMKFAFTALTLSCPIPGGIFTPTLCMGAVLG